MPTEKPEVAENKIPFREHKSPNPRVIETDFSKQTDSLPGLEPLRTLQTDSENKDDIISSKLGGSSVKKPEDKDVSTEIPKKNSGPDPYREILE